MDETAVDYPQNEAKFLLAAPLAMPPQSKVD
jgi:hypothetical protein